MAYGYPATYQPYYQQPYYQQNQSNGIIWIQGGLQSAKSYLTAPNTTVSLWDSEEQTIYLKTTDASGLPSIKILDYTVRTPEDAHKAPLSPVSDKIPAYATKDDLKALYERLNGEIEKLKENHESDLPRNESKARLNSGEI